MIAVAALYHFAPLADPAAARELLHARCDEHGLKGTLLLAPEGINGTIAGPREALDIVIEHIRSWYGFASMEVKYSSAEALPFGRMKVKVKREIVTMGVDGIDPLSDVGAYVAPQDWNALIADPDTILIDTRNDFEVQHGSFPGAINPETASFRQFPAWFDSHAAAWRADGKKIAMFCTGGIRCEKATAYAKAQGFGEVYHLKGGILKYLEDTPAADNLWKGDCFVFDEREALALACRSRAVNPPPLGEVAARSADGGGIQKMCPPRHPLDAYPSKGRGFPNSSPIASVVAARHPWADQNQPADCQNRPSPCQTVSARPYQAGSRVSSPASAP